MSNYTKERGSSELYSYYLIFSQSQLIFFPIYMNCRFSTAQKLDKLGMRGSDTYVLNELPENLMFVIQSHVYCCVDPLCWIAKYLADVNLFSRIALCLRITCLGRKEKVKLILVYAAL